MQIRAPSGPAKHFKSCHDTRAGQPRDAVLKPRTRACQSNSDEEQGTFSLTGITRMAVHRDTPIGGHTKTDPLLCKDGM
nr:hypothetical protein [Streptomyces sp. TLI_235]